MKNTGIKGGLVKAEIILLTILLCMNAKAAWNDVRLDIEESGIYYVSASDAATVLGEAAIDVKARFLSGNTALYNMTTQQVAYTPASGGEGLYFYGEAIDSVYTKYNSYRLEWLAGTQMPQVAVGAPAAVENGTFTETEHYEYGAFVLMSHFNDPEDDYWFWEMIMAGQAVFPDASFTNTVSGVSGITTQAQLTTWLRSSMTQGITNEHHAEISVNGTNIGGVHWTGVGATNIVLAFDQSLLQEGDNVFTVTGVLDGAWSSIFYVDDFELQYTRAYVAEAGQLSVTGGTNPVITAGEFASSNIWVADISDPYIPVLQNGVNIEQTGSMYRVSFTPAASATDYIAFATGRPPVMVAAVEVSDLKAGTNDSQFIVITPSDFLGPATDLVSHRISKRISARTVVLQDIYDEFNHGIRDPNAIKDFLTYAYNNWSKQPKYVVLAGAGSYDYKGYQADDCIIPVMLVDVPRMLYVSDIWYGDVENDDYLPEIVVGRLPALTDSALQRMVDRIIAYENAPMEKWQEKVILLADNADVDGNFPASSDRIGDIIPLHFTRDEIDVIVGSETNARNSLIAGINDGRLMVNFYGHSSQQYMTGDGVLSYLDMPLLTNSNKLTILTAMSCDMGRYADGGRYAVDALSEELMLCETGGTIAVWGPSGQAYNRASELLCQGFYTAVFLNNECILGDAVRQSMTAYNQSNMGKHLMLLYNLLGDPAMQIRGVSGQSDDPYSTYNEDLVDWKDDYFTTAELDDINVTGDYADPDGDGVYNYLEYLLGWDPTEEDIPRILELEDEPEDIGQEYDFVVQYQRSKWYTGLMAGVEVSTNLAAGWQNGTSWIVDTRTTDDGNQETETVEYYMKSPSEDVKYYVRFSAWKQ